MKTTYIVFTEQGRSKGKTEGGILKVTPDGTKLLTVFDFSTGSNQGIDSEVAKILVRLKELPEVAISQSGYVNYEFKEHRYELVIIEGRGLTYYSIR